MVSNVTLEGPMTAQRDYRFTVTVTWKPPVYPNITPSMYILKWSREDKLNRSHSDVRKISSCLLFLLTFKGDIGTGLSMRIKGAQSRYFELF